MISEIIVILCISNIFTYYRLTKKLEEANKRIESWQSFYSVLTNTCKECNQNFLYRSIVEIAKEFGAR